MGLGYNTFLLCPRPITLAKRYLRFYRCRGHCLIRSSADADKPARRHVIVIGSDSDDARPSYCVLSIFKKAAVLHLGFLL